MEALGSQDFYIVVKNIVIPGALKPTKWVTLLDYSKSQFESKSRLPIQQILCPTVYSKLPVKRISLAKVFKATLSQTRSHSVVIV